MRQPKALDLFAGAGGVSVGLARAGFDVTGVDSDPKVERYWRCGMEPYGGEFLCADALEVPLDGYDLIHASPPCQAYTALRHLCKGKVYPDLVDAVRERLMGAGVPWVIENVEGAPLAVPPGGSLVLLCGTMFGLQTPDGRAEIRRHRLFETSFPVVLRPACQHGGTAMVVTGHSYQTADAHSRRRVLCVAGGKAMSGGMMTPQGELKRRMTLSVVGANPEAKISGAWKTYPTKEERATGRETFSIDDARAAMGIDWMPMKYLSQAIPPSYASWIGRQALTATACGPPVAG